MMDLIVTIIVQGPVERHNTTLLVKPFHLAQIGKWRKIFRPCFTVTPDRLGESG